MRPEVDADAGDHFLGLNIVAGVQLGRRQRLEPPIEGLGLDRRTPIAAGQDRLVTRAAAPSREAEGLGRAHNRVGSRVLNLADESFA